MLDYLEKDNIRYYSLILINFKAEKKSRWVTSRKAAEDYNKKLHSKHENQF